MSLDKAIESGKEKRKPYKGSKSFDHNCRNHGNCSRCQNNRDYQTRKELEKAKSKEKES